MSTPGNTRGTDEAPRVVAGVDDSGSARAALHWAVGWARHTGARVVAITAWAPHLPVVTGPEIGATTVAARVLTDEQLQAQAQQWLADAIATLPTAPSRSWTVRWCAGTSQGCCSMRPITPNSWWWATRDGGHGSVPLPDRSRTNAYTTPAARSYWPLNPTTTPTFDRMVVFRSLSGQAATPVPGPAAGNAASTTLQTGGVMADDANVDRVRPNPLRWVAYAYAPDCRRAIARGCCTT
jgi:Universal stress protein family